MFGRDLWIPVGQTILLGLLAIFIIVLPLYFLTTVNSQGRNSESLSRNKQQIVNALKANPSNQYIQKQALDFNLELERYRGTVAFDTIKAIDLSQFTEKK
jgi:hypothetical protein